ncbi:WD40/YVTN/BNR-like repeat-containing protein [Pendulispora albinea]|uniref:IPT/TIG domain-containing protein n=1 Tax=Pendulispora albinea TaxID=2741071 RepID=A0ABZ2M1D4_9BACT
MKLHRRSTMVVAASLVFGILPACGGASSDGAISDEDEREPKAISLSPSAGPPGTQVAISGRHYAPNEHVTLQVDGHVVADLQADPDGSFQTTYVVPGELREGHHALAAYDQSGAENRTLYEQSEIPRLGSWTKVGGGFGNTPVQIAIAPSLTSTLYVATRTNGIYKSTDTGATWSAINAGLTNLNGLSLAVSANNATAVRFSADKAFSPPGTPTHLWQSQNGGGSWAALSPSPDINLDFIKVTPGTGLFAGGNNGSSAIVLLGTSGTTVWSSSTNNFGAGSGTVTAIVGPANALFASVYGAGTKSGGIFKSTDGAGATWTASHSGIAGLNHVTTVAVAPSDANRLYAAVEGQNTGVYKSANGGLSWTLVNQGLGDRNVWSLAVHPSTPDIVFAGTATGVYKSTDGGSSWSLSMSAAAKVNTIAIHPASTSTIFVGLNAPGELYQTTTGG